MILQTLTAGPFHDGRRIESVLRADLGLSRALLRRLKAEEGLLLNGSPAKAFERLKAGDQLRLVLCDTPSSRILAQPLPLAIAFEDDEVAVIDKAAGQVVHPTKGVEDATLANGLAAHLLAAGKAGSIHPIHRLDRETTGLVLFALNPLASQRLSLALQQGRIRRRYTAWVRGVLADDHGRIDLPIARLGGGSAKRAVRADGQPAVTHFEVDDRRSDRTRVSVRLETGRTHQIRVHFEALGHPLVGDPLYGPPSVGPLCLHAAQLAFPHPRNGEPIVLSAPLPAAFDAP